MNRRTRNVRTGWRTALGMLCAASIAAGDTSIYVAAARAQQDTQGDQAASADARIPNDQLDSLVAPIALYPDPLLAQTLAASTYPLELVQLQQWLARNPGLKDKALADAVAKQSWDASVQSMAALPDVVKRLTDDIQWTTDLGNAFLAQQPDVMQAVQRMRQKAQAKGTLKSSQQQEVQTQVVENKSVIVIEQSSPDVVYVPSYDPMLVYGAPLYPYPPIYYPPAGYYAAGAAISFGVGVAMGAFWGGGGGGWGWGAGWGNNDININNNNNFVRNSNVRNGNINGAGNRWQHNPAHRGGAPYGNRATANRYGGTARGDSLANRQTGARQQVGRQGGNLPSTRSGAVGTTGRSGLEGGAGARSGGLENRAGAGGGERVGQRDTSRGSGSGAFGGGAEGFSGSGARSSGDRGSRSLGSSGGGSRSGGLSGGGSRGGGGGSRGGGGGGRGGGRR